MAEIIDFPSDPNGECGNLRKECVKIVNKCATYPTKAKLALKVLKRTMNMIEKTEKARIAAEKSAAKLVAKGNHKENN